MNESIHPSFDNWCVLPTPLGEFRMYDSGDEALRVICMGDIHTQGTRPLLRVHSSCLASEVFGARDCDCADQLDESMKLIAIEGRGVIIHLHQEGRGHGLSLKIKAVAKMQCSGLDTVEAFEAIGLEQDIRCYQDAVRMLHRIGIDDVRLISNNPRKLSYLEKQGIRAEMVNTHPTVRPENADYLATKKAKLGHQLPIGLVETATPEPIRFYHSDQPWGELSNFSAHAVFLLNRIWPTLEHFYQAQKFSGMPYEERIRRAATPTLAKQLAKTLNIDYRRLDWEDVKDQIMITGLRAKFHQHPELYSLLLETRDRPLIEHTATDAYWGDGGDGTGKNRLGTLLVQVRDEIQRDSLVPQTKTN